MLLLPDDDGADEVFTVPSWEVLEQGAVREDEQEPWRMAQRLYNTFKVSMPMQLMPNRHCLRYSMYEAAISQGLAWA